MQNNYLELLELQPGATKKEVKSAYRRLSKRYHPDISKDDDAKEKFIEINEAYNFLTKVGPKPHQETTSYAYDPYAEEYRQRRQQARSRAMHRAREEARMQDELMKKILTGFNLFASLIIIFNITLATDYLLPLSEHPQEILEIVKVYEPYGYYSRAERHTYDELHFEDFVMRFEKDRMKYLRQYDKAVVMATPILKKPMSTVITVAGVDQMYDQLYNIYNRFGYIIPFMFILVLLYSRIISGLDNRLTLAIFMTFGFVLQLIFFFRY